jgi:cardiolipin synthase
MGMRLHHKIIVIDNKVALTGGINVSDHYSHFANTVPWLDFALESRGKVVSDLIHICNGTLQTARARNSHKLKVDRRTPQPGLPPVHARVLQNNWLRARFGISYQYRQNIRSARESILIFASYFVPSVALKRLLKKAAQRGVKVTIVLGAVSDVGLVRRASEHFYSDMLKAGIELYEWRPSVLHAKIALVDDKWFCVGSYNLNHLSDFGSIECNIEVNDNAFCSGTGAYLKQIILNDCDHISWILYNKRFSIVRRLYNALCYALVRLSLGFFFFLQNRTNKKEKVVKPIRHRVATPTPPGS